MSEGAVCAFWLVMLNLRLHCADDFLSAKMMVLSLQYGGLLLRLCRSVSEGGRYEDRVWHWVPHLLGNNVYDELTTMDKLRLSFKNY